MMFMRRESLQPSPHKLANPLDWPFGALPPQQLARLRRERAKQQPQPVREPAPF